MQVRKRKSVFALVGPLPQVAAYVLAPWFLSRRARRHGWRDGRPSALNLAGLAPLGAGAAVITAAIVSHYSAAPSEMRVSLVPDYLVTGGIYSRTRNPLYLGGLMMQAGWAVLLGSLPGSVATLAYAVGMNGLGIPFEERLLRATFGNRYELYADSVPRWI